MKAIAVTLTGTAPILMNNISLAIQEQISQKTKKTTQQRPSAEEEAEQRAYRTKEGFLMIPARCVKASILNSAGWYKFNNRSAKQILAGATRIEPRELSLGTKKYEIDLRTVVIAQGKKRNRIVRARPRLDEWKISFKLIYNEEMIKDSNIIKDIVVEAGLRMGLLDFRPQYFGDCGTFELTEWKETKI